MLKVSSMATTHTPNTAPPNDSQRLEMFSTAPFRGVEYVAVTETFPLNVQPLKLVCLASALRPSCRCRRVLVWSLPARSDSYPTVLSIQFPVHLPCQPLLGTALSPPSASQGLLAPISVPLPGCVLQLSIQQPRLALLSLIAVRLLSGPKDLCSCFRICREALAIVVHAVVQPI